MLYQNISFCHPFRDYQQRVLDTLDEKLSDNKIHIVAAPGSGKTVLGLELVRRLDIPVLVLTPSISIREQWIDRFLTLFVRNEDIKYWSEQISDTLDNPKTITCITYQALYAKYQDISIDNIAATLLSIGVNSIVLDEAHHLKREWWKALAELESKLKNPTIISLTATPPYDASSYEWNKYNNLCGEIDIELFTPEMVQKNTLCPYQDFVYLCAPTNAESSELLDDYFNIHNFYKEILNSKELYEELKISKLLTDSQSLSDVFINNENLLSSLVRFVSKYMIPNAHFYEATPKDARNIINTWNKEILKAANNLDKNNTDKNNSNKNNSNKNNYNKETIENNSDIDEIFTSIIPVLIESEYALISEEYTTTLIDSLKANHLLKNNRFSTEKHDEKVDRLLKNSTAKLGALCDIAHTEVLSMHNDLSMLILVDNIGKENLSLVETSTPITSMDCISVFESLRRQEHLQNIDAYMNAGTMDNHMLQGTNLAVLCGSICIIPESIEVSEDMSTKPLGNTGYMQVSINDSNRKNIVGYITDLVNKKLINILIGTVSLLGEGWDAPSINTVILASNVSSYVQSNQMRGRGLRVDSTNPSKTANIWHLCCLMPTNNGFKASREYSMIKNRFEALLGLDINGETITNGIDRLNLPDRIRQPLSANYLNDYNSFTKKYASERSLILNQWKNIYQYNDLSNVRETLSVEVSNNYKIKNTSRTKNETKKLATGLLKTLKSLNIVSEKVTIGLYTSKKGPDKTLNISIDNCTSRERNTYINSLKNVLNLDKYGKYIIKKNHLFSKPTLIGVPDCLKNQNSINVFMKNTRLRKLELLQTKSPEAIELIFRNNLYEQTLLKSILRCGK